MKHIIITGGHSGIGLELTKILLKEGHQLGLIVRNEHREATALKELGTHTKIDFFYADLSNQREVETVGLAIRSKWEKVDILFNNAGVLLPDLRYSNQGNEMHYEVNTLAPYLLTIALKDLFLPSASPVIINTVTDTLQNQKTIDIDELRYPTKFKKLFGAYMQSKLALTLLMNQLAKDWKGVRIINVSPGPNKTKMTAGEGMPVWLKPIRNLFFAKPTKGAQLLYQAAFDERHRHQTGVYLQKNKGQKLPLTISEEQKNQLLAGAVLSVD